VFWSELDIRLHELAPSARPYAELLDGRRGLDEGYEFAPRPDLRGTNEINARDCRARARPPRK